MHLAREFGTEMGGKEERKKSVPNALTVEGVNKETAKDALKIMGQISLMAVLHKYRTEQAWFSG